MIRPVVSIIITCYNYGHFLAEAIESALQQTYQYKEVVLVDDGSTDNTREVALRYPGVKYIYQHNQGLSAARNTGIRSSKGQYLVFLDADDWLLPNALSIGVPYLRHHPQAAFVAGSHKRVYTDGQKEEDKPLSYAPNPYYRLLSLGNYIGMISAVMFTRWALSAFHFDTSLRNCEDYDLYLNLTRRYPIVQHQHSIAAYRIHRASMSADIDKMLIGVQKVLDRQRTNLRSPLEIEGYSRGMHCWITYYEGRSDYKLEAGPLPDYQQTIQFFERFAPQAVQAYAVRHEHTKVERNSYTLTKGSSRLVQPAVPLAAQIRRAMAIAINYLLPFESRFGYDLRWPVERGYIEQFRQQIVEDLNGVVLDLQDSTYKDLPEKSTLTDALELTGATNNAQVYYKRNLLTLKELPGNTFDCIVFTHSLHTAYNFKTVMHHCRRVLKPGGTLFLTVPGKGEWNNPWYWSFTADEIRRLLVKIFSEGSVQLESLGNADVAVAYLYGLELTSVDQNKLSYHDPEYQVMHTIRVTT